MVLLALKTVALCQYCHREILMYEERVQNFDFMSR